MQGGRREDTQGRSLTELSYGCHLHAPQPQLLLLEQDISDQKKIIWTN